MQACADVEQGKRVVPAEQIRQLARDFAPLKVQLMHRQDARYTPDEERLLEQGKPVIRLGEWGLMEEISSPLNGQLAVKLTIPPDPLDMNLLYWTMNVLIGAAIASRAGAGDIPVTPVLGVAPRVRHAKPGSTPMAAILAFFGIHAAVALLTWWRSRRRAGGDFFLGRRTLSAPVVAMSLLLTNLSTEQLVGLNGDGYRHGAVVIAWEIFGAFGLVLFAVVFLPRYWTAGVTTIPEFIEQRCGAPTRRLMTVLMLLSLVGIGLPFVLYSGALALVGIFDLPGRLGI
eukprot:gene3074-3963_t